MIVKNPIDRVVSAILEAYLKGNHKKEVMLDIDDLIMNSWIHPSKYKDVK